MPFINSIRKQDPITTLKFSLFIDGIELARATSITGLGDITEAEEVREGGSNKVKLLPKRTRNDPVTLTQGIILTDNTFEEWRATIASLANDGRAIYNIRKNAVITAYGKNRDNFIRYRLRNCWPSSIKRPDFNAIDGGIAFFQMILQVEDAEQEGLSNSNQFFIDDRIPKIARLQVDY